MPRDRLAMFGLFVGIFLSGLCWGIACTPRERAIVRTVVDVANVVCADGDPLDVCAEKINRSPEVARARAARMSR